MQIGFGSAFSLKYNATDDHEYFN